MVLLVDAAESVLPHTKFVLSKALKLGLKPIVVINKIDRHDAQPTETLENVFDLFLALEANDDQLDFHHLFASGRSGWAVNELEDERKDLTPLFERIVADVPKPKPLALAGDEHPFKMLVTTLEADPYLGRILTGRIESGAMTVNRVIKAMHRDGKEVERPPVTKLLAFRGLARVPVVHAEAGDLIAIAGLQIATVADTLCDPQVAEPIAATPIDPPTLAITLAVNDSPLAGREGDKVQSRVIRERLYREAEGNVAIKVGETGEGAFEVAGRGELQLGVLVENMRREGFELSISRPRVLFKKDEATGERMAPIEEVTIDVDDPYTGVVIETISLRKAELQAMRLRHTYRPREYYERNARIKRIVDAFKAGLFSKKEPGLFAWILTDLLNENDEYFHLADLPSYLESQQKASAAYCDEDRWTTMSILNVARVGKFSADCVVSNYAREIWDLKAG